MNIQQRILKFVSRANWVLLLITSAAGSVFTNTGFTIGIMAGGLLVTINFQLTCRTIKKTLTPPHFSSTKSILAKYYVRFLFSVMVIFILISKQYVDPGGLLIGLSIVVASIMIAALCELKKIILKEAV
jgi:hypothetical protein